LQCFLPTGLFYFLALKKLSKCLINKPAFASLKLLGHSPKIFFEFWLESDGSDAHRDALHTVECNVLHGIRDGKQARRAVRLAPNEYSSGARRRLGRISCKCNTYVRTLFIHGSRAALLAAQRCQARTPEKLTELQRWAVETAARIGHNKAAVALANKLVRICWAVWCHERRFNGNWQLAKHKARLTAEVISKG
jgi:hypothetical protein